MNKRAEGWKEYGFETLYGDVLRTLDLDGSENLTVTAQRCVSILNGERNRMRRIDEWNQKQKK